MNWYLLRTRPAQEEIASANLSNQHIETLTPVFQALVSNGYGKRKLVVKPLFPRYIFAQFEYLDCARSVRGTRGVSQIVTFADSPAVVEPWVIEEIQARIVDGFVQMQEEVNINCPFRPGEHVRIIDGPMCGFPGVFLSYVPAKQRVDILMDMFGRKATIRFGLDEVEPLSYALV